MNKSYKKKIDAYMTLEQGLDEGCFFIMDDRMYRDMLYCGDKGPVMQPSLFIDNGDGYLITRITKQFPLDFYVNEDGKRVKIKPAEVSPYLISVFDTTTGKKTVYEAKEVATDVPFNPNELSDWQFWCDEYGKNVPTEETECF